MTPPRQPRVNWDAARAFYIALGPVDRTFARVAAEYHVTEHTVGKWARRQGWVEAAARADAHAAAKLQAEADRSLEQRQRDTIRVAEKLRRRILDANIDEIDLTAAIRTMPRFAALEQLFAGEATSRVDVGEVQAYVVALVTAAGEFVPAARRQEFLDRVRELESGFGELGEQAA